MTTYAPAAYTGDGSTVSFAVPFPYLNRTDVIVTVAGAVVSGYTWTSASMIAFNVAPLAGQLITISRSTSTDPANSSFSAGDLSGPSLNRAVQQSLFAIQELALGVSLVGGLLVCDGVWDANANSPSLASGVGTSGHYRVVATAGTTNLNGIASWSVGDLVLYNGTAWSKVNGSTTSIASSQITDSTAVGRALLTSVSVAAQRASLGLATVASSGNYNDLSNAPGYVAPRVCGRLTLSSLSPVMAFTVTGATSVYFTPYEGNTVPVWNGSSWVSVSFTEISQLLSDATKSPAAAVANTNYDMFVWLDGGVLRCTRGYAWANSTTRGTGAGTTELGRANGFLNNRWAITNGPAAGYGLYVGSVRTNPSGTIDWILGSQAAGGGQANFLVWNNFNRRVVTTQVQDTQGYTYTTAAWRPFGNSTNNRVNFIIGWPDDAVTARFAAALHINTNGANYPIGVGIDTTSSVWGVSGSVWGGSAAHGETVTGEFCGVLVTGLHYAQAMELGGATQSTDGYSALTFSLPM